MDTQLFSVRLREARQMMNLSMDQLSERTGHAVTKQSISKYEKAKMMPRGATLALLAKALDISVEYFNGTNMQLDAPMLRNSFKKEPTEEDMQRVEAQLSFWAEQYIRAEHAVGIETPFVNPLRNLIVKDFEGASHAADRLREEWRCGDGPIPSILRLMERKGVKILDKPLPGGMLGMSTMADGKLPLVVIDMANEKHTVERLRFTSAHELGHLVLNIPDDIVGGDREKLCEKFAGYFLLPHATLLEEIGSDKRDKVTFEELIDIHDQYGVSVAALVHELWDFRIINREQYDWWYNERINKNRKEVGWGAYLFPETLGREKRIKSNINN